MKIDKDSSVKLIVEGRTYTPPMLVFYHHRRCLPFAACRRHPKTVFYRVSSLTSLFSDTIINLINEGRISL